MEGIKQRLGREPECYEGFREFARQSPLFKISTVTIIAAYFLIKKHGFYHASCDILYCLLFVAIIEVAKRGLNKDIKLDYISLIFAFQNPCYLFLLPCTRAVAKLAIKDIRTQIRSRKGATAIKKHQHVPTWVVILFEVVSFFYIELWEDEETEEDKQLIVRGKTVKFRSAFGSGKSTRDIPDLVHSLKDNFSKVCIASANESLALQMQRNISKRDPEVVYVSQETPIPCEANIISVTHDKALSIFLHNKIEDCLVIMDDSENHDLASGLLLDQMKIMDKSNAGAEFDSVCEGELEDNTHNYKILETHVSEDEIVGIVSRSGNPKTLVFCTSVLGNEETSIKSLKKKIKGKKVAVLTKSSIYADYTRAQSPDTEIILSDSTAESGMDLMCHNVVDFQRDVDHEWPRGFSHPIDQIRKQKRKSKIGRFTHGIYFSPNIANRDSAHSNCRAQHRIMALSIGVPMRKRSPGLIGEILTKDQVKTWARCSKLNIHSTKLINNLIDENGNFRNENGAWERAPNNDYWLEALRSATDTKSQKLLEHLEVNMGEVPVRGIISKWIKIFESSCEPKSA